MAVLSASIRAEHIVSQSLIVRFNALGISFSVKLLDHVLIDFIFSKFKKFQELWGWKMQRYKWTPQIKCLFLSFWKSAYLVSFAGSLKSSSRFKGWVGYQCWQTLREGHRDMAGWHKPRTAASHGETLWERKRTKTEQQNHTVSRLVLVYTYSGKNILISTTVRRFKRRRKILIFCEKIKSMRLPWFSCLGTPRQESWKFIEIAAAHGCKTMSFREP